MPTHQFSDDEKKAIRFLRESYLSKSRVATAGRVGEEISCDFPRAKKLLRQLEALNLVEEGEYEYNGRSHMDAFKILPAIVSAAEHLNQGPDRVEKFIDWLRSH